MGVALETQARGHPCPTVSRCVGVNANGIETKSDLNYGGTIQLWNAAELAVLPAVGRF